MRGYPIFNIIYITRTKNVVAKDASFRLEVFRDALSGLMQDAEKEARMHTLRFMAAILLLVPLAAQAESEYTACLKGLHQQSSVLLASRWPSQQRVPSVLKSDNSTHRFEPAASPAVVKFSL